MDTVWGEEDSVDSDASLTQFYSDADTSDGDENSLGTLDPRDTHGPHLRATEFDKGVSRARRMALNSSETSGVVHLGTGSCPLSSYMSATSNDLHYSEGFAGAER